MPASVPTGAGELLPPRPWPFLPHVPTPAAGVGSEHLPPPSGAPASSRAVIRGRLQPTAGLCTCHSCRLGHCALSLYPPHTPVSPSAPQGSFSNVLIRCLRSSPFRHSGLGARAGVRVCLRSSRGLPPPRPGRQLLVGRNQSHLLAAAGPSTERTAPPRGPRAHAARARMLGTPVPATEAARGHFPQFVFVKEEKGMLSHITRVPPERALPPAPWGLGPPPHPCALSSPRQLHAPHPQACPHNRGPQRRPAAVWSSPRPFLCRGLIRASSFLVRVRRNQRTRTGSEPQLGGQPTSDLLLAPTLAPPCLRFQGSGPGISRTRRPCHSVRPPAKACQ